MLIGYSTITKGYRIYNPVTNKISTCRDVVFEEAAEWNWEKHEVQSQQQDEIEFNQAEIQLDNDNIDEPPVRGTRSLANIYHTCNVAVVEPASFDEAVKAEGWQKAMKEELSMIEKNKTWQLVARPKNKKVIGVKWVYRTKLNPDGSINKLKARLVVKGYAQQEGVDYSDTFAPVARHDTVRLLLALAAKLGWKVYHLDVKSAFLNGLLEEDIMLSNLNTLLLQLMKTKFTSFLKLFMA